MNRSTILFFVHYKYYINNWIDPIFLFLNKQGFDVVIFHMDSLNFGNSKNIYVNNINYDLYDINEMGTRITIDTIHKLDPQIIIFLNFESLADLYLLKISKFIGIPTLYMQHGLFDNQTFKFKPVDVKSSILRYIRLLGMFFNLLFNYCNNFFSECLTLFKVLFFSDYRDSKFDNVMLYTEENLSYINHKFNYNEHQVHYSGYPLFERNVNIHQKNNRQSVLLNIH